MPEVRTDPASAAVRTLPAFSGGTTGGTPLERETEIARAAGYTAGWTSGLQAARAEVQREHERLTAQLRAEAEAEQSALRAAAAALLNAAERVETSLRPDFDRVEEAVLDTAVCLSAAILGHEVAAATHPGRDAMRRALDLSPGRRPIAIRMNPDDAATVDNPVVRLELGLPEDVTVVPDPGLAPGDSVAQYLEGSVEVRLAAGLARAAEVLGR